MTEGVSLNLEVAEADLGVWRIGYQPDPWAWSDWSWAVDGRFNGRWDDSSGSFRTVYAASNLLGCLLEVLACFRPDPVLAAEMNDIDEGGAPGKPTSPAGLVPYDWTEKRLIGTATLRGRFCAATAAQTIAALRPTFLSKAIRLGLKDFDAAALKDGSSRALTQAVATYLKETTEIDGVVFSSRLGDELELWAIFEKANDPRVSPTLINPKNYPLSWERSAIENAFQILGLGWAGPTPAQAPLPIEEVPGDDGWRRYFPGGSPDPSTPLGAACLWWQALSDLEEYKPALHLLSCNPEVWGDYSTAADAIADLSILTKVEDNSERGEIKYIRFIPYGGSGFGRAFADAPMHDVWIVTMVKPPGDSWWRVWALSHNYFPAAKEVLDTD